MYVSKFLQYFMVRTTLHLYYSILQEKALKKPSAKKNGAPK